MAISCQQKRKMKHGGPENGGGQTPVLDKKLTRDHLSVMAGLTPGGKLYTLVRRESLSSLESVVFLKHLLAQTRTKMLVIWDGSPIHRWGAVRDLLAAEGAKHIHLEALPGYAPDLSPLDQGCWHHLKDVEMANLQDEPVASLQAPQQRLDRFGEHGRLQRRRLAGNRLPAGAGGIRGRRRGHLALHVTAGGAEIVKAVAALVQGNGRQERPQTIPALQVIRDRGPGA